MSAAQQRAAVVAEAKTWLGTPYHHHARIKGAGVDCAQFLCAVFETCGLIARVDTGFYPVDWHLHHSEELFSMWLSAHARAQTGDTPAQPGDVWLFKYGRTFSHGSIYVGDGLLIHSYLGRGVILSRFDEEPLQGRTKVREIQRWSFWP